MWHYLYNYVWYLCCAYLILLVKNHPIQSSYTLVTLEAECRRNENSFYIPGYSKCILKILTAFQIFGPILVAGPNVFIMLKTFEVHSKWKNIERHSKCIPTAFKTFWLPSKENRNGKPFKFLPECPVCASNEPECILIAAGIYFDIKRI